jgi:hypothetical protein
MHVHGSITLEHPDIRATVLPPGVRKQLGQIALYFNLNSYVYMTIDQAEDVIKALNAALAEYDAQLMAAAIEQVKIEKEIVLTEDDFAGCGSCANGGHSDSRDYKGKCTCCGWDPALKAGSVITKAQA